LRATVHPGLAVAGLMSLAACGGGGSGGGVSPGPQALPPPPPAAPAPQPPSIFDTPEYRRSDAAVASNVLPAWAEGASGAGVIVGLLDSGIASTNPEFAGRIHPSSRDVTGNGRPIADEGGHGTSVAGVLAAARDNSGIVGIAPQVTLAVYRADRPGSCGTDDGCRYNDSALAAGIDAAIAVGARAVNISLGGTGASPVLRDAFVRGGQAGVVLVLSAGNDSRGEVNGLALSALQAAGGATVVVVGSVGSTRQLSDFSNQAGQAANNYVAALGERVRSFNQNGQAFLYSGTSYSAPQVTGAIALLAQAFPQLSPAQLVRLVLESADDAGIPGTDNIYGRGILNIGRAFQPIGQTSLAATATPVSLATNGQLGAPMGGGEGFGNALGLVPVSDSFGRVFALPVARTIRPHTPARLARALGLDTSLAPVAHVGAGSMSLSARTSTAMPTADAYRWALSAESHLGLAQRGVSAQRLGSPRSFAGRFTSGPLGFAIAEGPGASIALPGESPFARLVAPDAFDPAADLAARAIRAAAAEVSSGRLRLGLSVEHGRAAAIPGRSYERMEERRVTASVQFDAAPLQLALRGATVASDGGFLGARGGPALGIVGGEGQEISAALGFAMEEVRLRAAGTLGWHRPFLSGAGLLQPGDGAIATSAWSFAMDVPLGSGRLHAAIAQPVAVTGGSLRLLEPLAGRAEAPLPLAPPARERALELGWNGPAGAFGSLSVTGFHRANPGHFEGLADTGAAIRLRRSF
jgi:hypothetical protein